MELMVRNGEAQTLVMDNSMTIVPIIPISR